MQNRDRPQTVKATRKLVVLQGEAREGSPVMGTEATQEFNGLGFELTETTVLKYCSSCHAVIPKLEAIGGQCSCGAILCPACATSNRCSECSACLCSECRRKLGASLYCPRHFSSRLAGVVVACVFLGILSLLLFWWLFNLVR